MKHKKGHAIHRIRQRRALNLAETQGDALRGQAARRRASAGAGHGRRGPRHPTPAAPPHPPPPLHPPHSLGLPGPAQPTLAPPQAEGCTDSTPRRTNKPLSWKLITELNMEQRKSSRPQTGGDAARAGLSPSGRESPLPRRLAPRRPRERPRPEIPGPPEPGHASGDDRSEWRCQGGRCGVLVLRKQPQAPK